MTSLGLLWIDYLDNHLKDSLFVLVKKVFLVMVITFARPFVPPATDILKQQVNVLIWTNVMIGDTDATIWQHVLIPKEVILVNVMKAWLP